MSGVSTICFAASYAVALVLEISRLLFRSNVRRLFRLGFAAAGLLAHSAFLYYRALNATGAPLSSEKDWYLVAAWALVVVYLYLALFHPKAPFGLFLLPLALGLIATATFLAPDVPLARAPASKIWGAIHGISIVLATVSVLVGFVAGLMYLGQVRHLKHKISPWRGPRLPSLEWLQWANGRAMVVSVLMLGVGVLAGMVLNLINIRSQADHLPWTDPVVLATWLMFFFLLAAVVLSAFDRPARSGRKVAYLTLFSFVFLVIVLAAGLLMDSRHWGRTRGEKGEGSEERGQSNISVIENWPFVLGHRSPDSAMRNDACSTSSNPLVRAPKSNCLLATPAKPQAACGKCGSNFVEDVVGNNFGSLLPSPLALLPSPFRPPPSAPGVPAC
jgi:ABC-type transport system involved in cytochrome c biogenesis permease subunit